MSSTSIKKIIPCKKNQLIEMVLDIEKYPEFVPWCIEGKRHEINESADLITFNGDLKVGKSLLNETFYSQVSYHKEKDKIIVTNLDGPLKHLKNEWTFRQFGAAMKHADYKTVHVNDDFVIKPKESVESNKYDFTLGINKELNEENFYNFSKIAINDGATILGGCCHIGPSHIKKISKLVN